MADVFGRTWLKKGGSWAPMEQGTHRIYTNNDAEDGWGTGTSEQGEALAYVKIDSSNYVRCYPSKQDGPHRSDLIMDYDFMENLRIGVTGNQTYEGSYKGGDVKDQSSNQINQAEAPPYGATWVRGAMSSGDRYIFGYFDFDGTNDYLACSNDSGTTYDIDPNDGLSVSTWCYSDGNHNGIMLSGDDPAGRARIFQIKMKSTGKWLAVCFQNGGTTTIPATIAGSNTTWTHVAFTATKSGNNHIVKLYINGQLEDTETWTDSSGNMSSGTPRCTIGMQEHGDNGNPFNGRIATVRMWQDRVLTDAEVEEDYDHWATFRFGH